MPSNPTPRLHSLLAYLLKSPNLKPNPTSRNPRGQRLPLSEHTAFCAMHDNETNHIPHGISQGWPTSPNWAELERRMGRDMSEYVWNVIMGKVGGEFFRVAKEEWDHKGKRKMQQVINELGSIHIEQPG